MKLDNHRTRYSMRLNYFIYTVALSLSLSACSGSRTVVEDNTPGEVTFEEKLEALPESETFDPSAYPTNPVEVVQTTEHAVPVELMEGRASEGLTAERTGYRVQVALVREKNDADGLVDEVTQWLQKMRTENPHISVFQSDLPVHNIYLQPYFRVRIGDFSRRDYAEELLTHLIEDYPRALVVVDQVTTNE